MLIDTDILIRFLTNDDENKAKRFEKFLRSGKKARILDVTVAEIYWVLLSSYGFSKNKVILGLESLIGKKSINCNRKVLRQTIKILKKGKISFVDAYTAATSLIQDEGVIMSYDKGFDKLPGVKRVEP